MENLTIGVHIAAAGTVELVDRVVEAEQVGVEVAWLTVGGLAPDPFAVFAAAAVRTQRIEFGTSIVPTFPRHPLAMAQGAMSVDQLAPGRLRLGVGPSHKPFVEPTWGIPFEKPQAHLREYLSILKAVLNEGSVSFHGELLHAQARIAGPTQVRVMASALRKKGFHLCGELAEGAISWMCPLPYIRDVAAPALQAGADAAGRPKPKMIVHTPVVVCEDAKAIHAAARSQFGFYQRMPYYSNMLQDAGYPEAADQEFTDRMADALILSGSEKEVADKIRALPRFGADEMLAAIVMLPDDPAPAARRTLGLLGELAQE